MPNKFTTIISSIVLLLLAAGPAIAQECADNYADGIEPVILREAVAKKALVLCYDGFAVLHSGVTRTPLWAAEHLTRERIAGAKHIAREDVFYPEAALSTEDRAELIDYARSGFDRGHMAPSGDMSSRESQSQSFSLANIIPQKAGSNRGVWRGIETNARQIARDFGSAFVVTGPVFSGATLTALNDRVLVPSHTFKAIYVPEVGLAGAYIADNSDTPAWAVISIDELTPMIGVDVFPGLPSSIKSITPPWAAPAD